MTAGSKRMLLDCCYAAALLVPMIAVPWITFSLEDWGNAATLDDPNPAVRVAALRAIGYGGHVDLLIRGLQDEDADVRYVAAVELRRRGRDAGSHVNVLIALLKDEHKDVRGAAIDTLNAIGVPAIPALLEALTDPDPRVRSGALASLGPVGPRKSGRERSLEEWALFVPALEKLREDEDAEIRQKAETLLQDIRREIREKQ